MPNSIKLIYKIISLFLLCLSINAACQLPSASSITIDRDVLHQRMLCSMQQNFETGDWKNTLTRDTAARECYAKKLLMALPVCTRNVF